MKTNAPHIAKLTMKDRKNMSKAVKRLEARAGLKWSKKFLASIKRGQEKGAKMVHKRRRK